MNKKLNWGIIGLGTVAHEWAQSFKNNKTQNLYAASSRSITKAKEFCSQYNIEKAYTHDELLNDKNVDIVYIATPHNLHYPQIKAALLANKHVFSEKAITLNAKELEELIAIAKERNLILLEGMTLFYMPISKKIKSLITSGKYGPLKMMQVNFGSYKPYDPKNRFFNPELAGGAILDIGVYAIAACVYYMSKTPKLLHTTVVKAETGADEESTMSLRNENELATINLTFRAKMPKRCLIALEEGYFEIYNYPRAESATFTTHNGEVTNISCGETIKAFNYEQEIMEDLIINQKENKYIELSLEVMKIIDNCFEMWSKENA